MASRIGRVDAELTHVPKQDAPQVGTNPAQAMVREKSDLISDISATGSIPRRSQHAAVQEYQRQALGGPKPPCIERNPGTAEPTSGLLLFFPLYLS